MKKLILLIPIAAFLIGCDAGETKVETVTAPKGEVKKDSMAGAVQSNPGIPDAAKKALLNQNGK